MSKVLILGAKGMLGRQLSRIFFQAVCWDREEADVTDFRALRDKVLGLPERPDAVINCVAYNDVDRAETNPLPAMALNADFVRQLAEFCAQLEVPLVHFSSNYVFDGQKGEYNEQDEPSPLSAYGRSKSLGEQALLKLAERSYLVRTSVLFGPKGQSDLSKRSFVELMLDLSEKSDTIKAVNDEYNSITLASDLAGAVKYLLDERRPYGIYHAANVGAASWYDIARETFFILGKKVNLQPVSAAEFPRPAQRPRKSVLLNTKLPKFQPWPEALKEFLVREYLTKRPSAGKS